MEMWKSWGWLCLNMSLMFEYSLVQTTSLSFLLIILSHSPEDFQGVFNPQPNLSPWL